MNSPLFKNNIQYAQKQNLEGGGGCSTLLHVGVYLCITSYCMFKCDISFDALPWFYIWSHQMSSQKNLSDAAVGGGMDTLSPLMLFNSI